jgi:hypothetical protein
MRSPNNSCSNAVVGFSQCGQLCTHSATSNSFRAFQQRNELCQKIILTFRINCLRKSQDPTIRIRGTVHHTPIFSECRGVPCTACGFSELRIRPLWLLHVTTGVELQFIRKEIVRYMNPITHKSTKSMAISNSCSCVPLLHVMHRLKLAVRYVQLFGRSMSTCHCNPLYCDNLPNC